MCHTFSVSSFSGKVSNIGIPLVKKAQFVSLLPVSSPFTHYQSWLFNLVAYLVGLMIPRGSERWLQGNRKVPNANVRDANSHFSPLECFFPDLNRFTFKYKPV